MGASHNLTLRLCSQGKRGRGASLCTAALNFHGHPARSRPLIRLSSFVYTGRLAALEHSLLPFSLYGAL